MLYCAVLWPLSSGASVRQRAPEALDGVVPAALRWSHLLQFVHVAPALTDPVYPMDAVSPGELVARAGLWYLLALGALRDYSFLFPLLQVGGEAWYAVGRTAHGSDGKE